MTDPSPPRRHWRRWVLLVYILLVGVSHLVRARRRVEPTPREGETVQLVQPVRGDAVVDGVVQLAFRDDHPPLPDSARPVVVLVHGSPGDNGAFWRLAPALGERFRVIAPDLPGFGASSHRIPDYSFRAHARYLLELLDSLGIERAHLVGFSMGGGVVLNMYDLAPERVSSVVLLSAIGVQELELMGDYQLNHAVHGLQLAGLWLLREATPHMGLLDDGGLSYEYARNFFDSDQRPLRHLLERFRPPMLIIHGDKDPLVPPPAAVEHHRIVPQSELRMLDGNHFMTFLQPDRIAPLLTDWVERVEAGQALTRTQAPPDRVARAEVPFDPQSVPPAEGFSLAVLMVLIAGATLVSEDLTAIGTGLMVARGTIPFWWGTAACFFGITLGDMMLFFAGRWIGRPALRLAPFRWFVSEGEVERSSAWFRKRGGAFVLASRFTPGTRTATYFASGMLHTSFWWFAFYFIVAGVLWTPLLVGLSAAFGAQMADRLVYFEEHALAFLLVMALVVLVVLKLGVPMLTHRGRRLLRARWWRMRRWECWPPVVFYPPVVAYVLGLGLRHRSLTLFTAANPAMPLGGFVGESKSTILAALDRGAPGTVAATLAVDPRDPPDRRVAAVRAFMEERGLTLPVVVKPDVGERGRGVCIVREPAALEKALRSIEELTLVQEYVGGHEYGVFYYRRPEEPHGRVCSITDKRPLAVTGDGHRSLERLILDDPRAVLSARQLFRRLASRLVEIPAAGEEVVLVEIGTHARGARFVNGWALRSEALERAVDHLAQGYSGFHFGRFDLRVPDEAALRDGRDLRVIELNGVTSEATHIYDPDTPLREAYRTLFAQWRLAFEIGAANRARGAPVASLGELMVALFHRVRRPSRG